MAHIRSLVSIGQLGQVVLRQAGRQQHPKLTIYSTTQIRTRFNPANPGVPYPREGVEETDEEFDTRYENYFNRPDIDGWELRKGINDMQNFDLVPEPRIMIAVLKACRRVDDHSLAVRYLEAVMRKANYKKNIVDYLMQEIRPTLNELGISTPAEMGYDEPELALGDPDQCSIIEKPL